jgi:hypothetical protein
MNFTACNLRPLQNFQDTRHRACLLRRYVLFFFMKSKWYTHSMYHSWYKGSHCSVVIRFQRGVNAASGESLTQWKSVIRKEHWQWQWTTNTWTVLVPERRTDWTAKKLLVKRKWAEVSAGDLWGHFPAPSQLYVHISVRCSTGAEGCKYLHSQHCLSSLHTVFSLSFWAHSALPQGTPIANYW